MILKRFLPLLIILLPQCLLAQTDMFEALDSTFNARVRAMDDRYRNYTRQMDEDFASYLERMWEKFPVVEMETIRFDDKSNFVNVTYSAPIKYPSYAVSKEANYEEKKVPFFEKEIKLNVDVKTWFSMSSISEIQVSKAWRRLITTSFSSIIEGIDRQRKELQLNDWGAFLLVSKLADQIFKEDQIREKKVFMAFILTHAGYNVKLGRAGEGRTARLHLLIPFKTRINEWKTDIEGNRYYIWSGTEDTKLDIIYKETTYLYSYRKNLKLAKADLDLAIRDVPLLGWTILQKAIESKSKYLPVMKMAWRSSLTNYYDTYPSTILPIYANTPLSVETRKSLQNSFQQALDDMSKAELVEHLLFWFYHAFQYKLDEEERPLFSEQTIQSEYNDCEDRAIFFARILKEVADMDVVLIVFEGKGNKISHVATGVHFKEVKQGESKLHNAKEYMICDPSDKRCAIGYTLDEYRNSKYEVIELVN